MEYFNTLRKLGTTPSDGDMFKTPPAVIELIADQGEVIAELLEVVAFHEIPAASILLKRLAVQQRKTAGTYRQVAEVVKPLHRAAP